MSCDNGYHHLQSKVLATNLQRHQQACQQPQKHLSQLLFLISSRPHTPCIMQIVGIRASIVRGYEKRGTVPNRHEQPHQYTHTLGIEATSAVSQEDDYNIETVIHMKIKAKIQRVVCDRDRAEITPRRAFRVDMHSQVSSWFNFYAWTCNSMTFLSLLQCLSFQRKSLFLPGGS